jgi:hypothetical protein
MKIGSRIPKSIKEKVILQWLQGYTRERIAKENGIGTGTVSKIINEARSQKEYHDIDFLRETSIMLRQEGLELSRLGFAIRLKNNGRKRNKRRADGIHNRSFNHFLF